MYKNITIGKVALGNRFLLGFLAISSLVFHSLAAAAAAPTDPLGVTKTAATELTSRLTQDKTVIKEHPEHVEKLVAEVLLPIFDTNRMAKLVLAKNWKKATPSQQEAFTLGFEKILIRTYANAFAAFDGQEIVFLTPKFNKDGSKAIVRSEIKMEGSASIIVDYRLRYNDSQWMVYDAVIEGVGLVKSYRSQFADVIRQKGMAELIASLPS